MGQENTATAETEGTVNWQAATDFIAGKQAESEETPAQDEAAATENEPEFVEVSIRGRKVRMSAEDAAEYHAFVKDVRERDGRLGGEMQNLRERIARTEGELEATRKAVAPLAELQPPDIRLAEENFAEYHRQWQVYTDAKTTRVRAELLDEIESRERTRTQVGEKEDAAARFVSEFYDRHSHLAEPAKKDIVQLVYQRNAQEINALRASGSTKEAQDRLAELADEHIVALRAERKNTTTNRPPRVEGTGTPPARKAAPEPEADFSAADWVRQKRAAMRGDKKK